MQKLIVSTILCGSILVLGSSYSFAEEIDAERIVTQTKKNYQSFENFQTDVITYELKSSQKGKNSFHASIILNSQNKYKIECKQLTPPRWREIFWNDGSGPMRFIDLGESKFYTLMPNDRENFESADTTCMFIRTLVPTFFYSFLEDLQLKSDRINFVGEEMIENEECYIVEFQFNGHKGDRLWISKNRWLILKREVSTMAISMLPDGTEQKEDITIVENYKNISVNQLIEGSEFQVPEGTQLKN